MLRRSFLPHGWLLFSMSLATLQTTAAGQDDGPMLGTARMTQSDMANGAHTLDEVRAEGLKIFATPFNRLDGYGDGALNPLDTTSPGGRPSLQNNGTFLRVNGLDAQTCMECHSVGSNATVPFTFAVGGVGGANNNAFFQPKEIDVDDESGSGFAAFDGRFINPPFLFGSGGGELLAAEMTLDLQRFKNLALSVPDVVFDLDTHGVSFGSIEFDSVTGAMDFSNLEGIDEDLIVRPFGRKGEFSTVRAFDIDAMQFHMGMQPIEAVGQGVDDDQDGVVDEILTGEISALHVFNTNLERPEIRGWNTDARNGFAHFVSAGCADCHVPSLESRGKELIYSFPEVETNPLANEFMRVDLSTSPAGFAPNSTGGLTVRLFSDLKRHDMGPDLAESFGSVLDSQYVTARLWGVADTAPYLHDGRATTLTDAILLHGGEALSARNNFAQLGAAQRTELLTFLKRLRTPIDPAADLLP
ncbi:MAG: di-heme oxidoredictase family protein [Planctomycetota bacterium]|nr:di-heme oxidoredictase family protein [Planctomycetota bacterium]